MKASDLKVAPSPKKNDHISQTNYLNVTNYADAGGDSLAKIPKRKLSVFYRSFDVIAPTNDQGERATVEVRRSSSSPSVRVEERHDGKIEETESFQKAVLLENTCPNNHSVVKCTESSSSSSPEHLENLSSKKSQQNISKLHRSSPKLLLPRVRENTTIDATGVIESSFGGCFDVCKTRGDVSKKIAMGRSRFAPSPLPSYGPQIFSDARSIASNGSMRSDPANCKIKDSEYPRTFAGRGKSRRSSDGGAAGGGERAVEPEMSSREDSSVGSESEDESIERVNAASPTCFTNGSEGKQNDSNASVPISLPNNSDTSKNPEVRRTEEEETENARGFRSERQKRQKLGIRRALSEGEDDGCYREECHCKYFRRRESLGEHEEQLRYFPSLTNSRLRAAGLSNVPDMDTLYRENLPEDELERKYTAFSVGLSTDRITLQRRMTLSLRQRDLSERNFKGEVQKMQQDIQELSPLCTDRESIEKVERVRHRLDMVARCAHRVSCSAETLGAVRQEHRISRAVLIADRYLQLLRTRCENLAAEVVEIKRILLKHNIVIEETSGELDGDLPRIRYRSGLSNNRTMIARRRASIATIPRPLTTPLDVNKDGPRQRNSVSGRVTLRRPSLCSESQKWENEKLNRTDSSSTIGELRDIFEQAESRRTSFEENNNLLRVVDHTVALDTFNFANAEGEEFMITKQETSADSNATPNAGTDSRLCIKTAESLRLTRNLLAWRSMLCCAIIFCFGFYIRHVISSSNSYCLSSLRWWSIEELVNPYISQKNSSSLIRGPYTSDT